MSLRHTRKTFFAKLAGLVAAVGIAPKLLGKPVSVLTESSAAPQAPAPFAIRTDKRAIARTSDSL